MKTYSPGRVSPVAWVSAAAGLDTTAAAPSGCRVTDHENVSGSSSTSCAIAPSPTVVTGSVRKPGAACQPVTMGA